MKYLLAHDIGTSGNKATLYTTDGELVSSITHSYQGRFFNGNWAEQNPEDWWQAVCHTTTSLLSKIDSKDVIAVSFSGQMMACLCVDENGTPLRDTILYCDQRAEQESNDLLKKIDAFDIYKITGHTASAVYSLQKLLWVKNNEPDIYENTYKMLNPKDYIAFKMTGNMYTDYSDAGGTGAFDIVKLDWSEEILDLCEVDGDKFPEAKSSIFVCGEVTSSASKQTGLAAGTPVVIGAGDGCAAGVGAGSVSVHKSYTCIGSSAWVATTTKHPIVDEAMRTTTFPHAVPNLYHPCDAMQTGGASYNWAKNVLCEMEVAEAHAKGISPYELMNIEVASSPVGANGLIFLPYLLGERAPWWNPDAKGSFIGLKLSSNKSDMLRAMLEGVAYNLRIIADIHKEHVPIKTMSLVGGGAKGMVWRQILADIFGMDIEIPQHIEECSSMGAAVIAGVGVGAFSGFESIEKFTKTDSIQKPDSKNHAYYNGVYPVFKQAYKQLEEIFSQL